MLVIGARRIILHMDMNFMNINENHSGQKLKIGIALNLSILFSVLGPSQ